MPKCCGDTHSHRSCVPGGRSRSAAGCGCGCGCGSAKCNCGEARPHCACGCCPKDGVCEARPCFYEQGEAIRPRPETPGILVEKGTELYPECSIKGKMQKMVFDFATLFQGSTTANVPKQVALLQKIAYPDSQLYYPSSFGFEYNRSIIEQGVVEFANAYLNASVWFPANGWTLDTTKKYGVVGSGGEKKCYYQFCVEVQFRQQRNGSTGPSRERLQWQVTNDVWEFFVDEKLEKFYQIKEWLDGQVRRLQVLAVTDDNTVVDGNTDPTAATILTRDYENINLLPWPLVGECLESPAGFTNLPNDLARFPTSVTLSAVPDVNEPCADTYNNNPPNPDVVPGGKSCCGCARRCRCNCC